VRSCQTVIIQHRRSNGILSVTPGWKRAWLIWAWAHDVLLVHVALCITGLWFTFKFSKSHAHSTTAPHIQTPIADTGSAEQDQQTWWSVDQHLFYGTWKACDATSEVLNSKIFLWGGGGHAPRPPTRVCMQHTTATFPRLIWTISYFTAMHRHITPPWHFAWPKLKSFCCPGDCEFIYSIGILWWH